MSGKTELNFPGAYWLPERGKYYRFTPDTVLVMRPWPNPQAWFKPNGGQWLAASPTLNFWEANRFIDQIGAAQTEMDIADVVGRHPLGAALQAIPKEVLSATERSYFLGNSWRALSLIGRCPGALDLGQNAPLICGLLSIANTVRQIPSSQPLRAARALLKQPDGWKRWSQICRWLDLDDSKAFIRMTRKNLGQEGGFVFGEVKAVLRLWTSPKGQKMLQHLPQINGNLRSLFETALLLRPPQEVARILHPRLLAEHAAQAGRTGLTGALYDCLFLWEEAWDDRPTPILRSLEQAEELRALTVQRARVRAHGGEDPLLLPFPPPPLEGGDGIEPLDTDEKLQAESTDLAHCLGNGQWGKLARLRQGFAYSVTVQGERATLWIARGRKTPLSFEIEQLKGPNNSAVTAVTTRHIERWLQRQNAWIQHRRLNAPAPTSVPTSPLPQTWLEVPRGVAGSRWQMLEDEIPF
jgi:hypothetical protein